MSTATELVISIDVDHALERRGFRNVWAGDMDGDAMFELKVNDHTIAVVWDEHHFSHISIDGRCTDLKLDMQVIDREIRRLSRSTREQWLRWFVDHPLVNGAMAAWRLVYNCEPRLVSNFHDPNKHEPMDHEEWAICVAASNVAHHSRGGLAKIAILDALDKLQRDHGCSIEFGGNDDDGGSIQFNGQSFTPDDRAKIEAAMAEVSKLS